MTDVIRIIQPETTVIRIAGLQGPQGEQGPVGGEIPGTPTITSFENAQHDHLDAEGGGQITAAALSDFASAVAANAAVAANTTHRGLTSGNPHNVTKSDVGLGNVPNTDATARANHTGTQTANTISDFDTAVSANGDVAAAAAHILDTDNPHEVDKADVGLGNVNNTLHNLTATGAPTVNDDSGDGYSVGSLWFDTTADKFYACQDATVGAAVWVDPTARANHTGTQAASTISDFDTEVANNTDVAANTTHRGLTNNPHSVTKSQVGLGNVPNTDATARANHTGTQTASTISDFDTAVSANADVAAAAAHILDTDNPHEVNAADVGLGNVPNVDATARANHTGTQAASTISDFDTEVANNTDVAANTTHRGLTSGNPHNVTKSDVGLGNVQNVDQTNADNISSGTLSADRLSAAAIRNLVHTVGDYKFSARTSSISNVWLICAGGTIGNGSSGASVRANADMETLFTHLWNTFANTELAVSSGRGASAAADFAANKTIALPDLRGRVGMMMDNPGSGAANRVTGSWADVIGGASGAETHALSSGENAQHNHQLWASDTALINTTGASAVDLGRVTAGGSYSASHVTSNSGSGTAHNNMQPSYAGGVYLIYTGN